MSEIHFVERLRNQVLLDQQYRVWESGNWVVARERAARLASGGNRIYFHDSQASPSYLGGEIIGFRALTPDHPEKGRIIFIFKEDEEGAGILAGDGGWRNEQKTNP